MIRKRNRQPENRFNRSENGSAFCAGQNRFSGCPIVVFGNAAGLTLRHEQKQNRQTVFRLPQRMVAA
ncbi:MAG: hypothetical protein ACFNS8_02990 [Kingella oralis]